jgi:hypothetical protein
MPANKNSKDHVKVDPNSDVMSPNVGVTPTTEPEPQSAGDGNFTPKQVSSRNVLKQQKVAEVLEGGKSGMDAAPGGVIGRSVASYSGNDASITGSLAATPRGRGNARSDGRFGRKLDTVSNKITDLASEQVVVGIDGPKPLSESRDVQGADGVRRNDQTLRTKSKGKVPASHMFQRSLDIIGRDKLVFGVGQIVKQTGQKYLDDPEYSYTVQNGQYTKVNRTSSGRGNYVPRKLTFTINSNNVVTSMSFEVDDLSIEENDDLVVNEAAPHAKTHANAVEMHRLTIVEKAGDESGDNWSPLGQAIEEPNATISYLKDIEQDTGNVAYMAHRFAQLGLAYQLNRAGKDGNLQGQPLDEAFNAVIWGYRNSPGLDTTVASVLADDYEIWNGSPALLIAAFDSLKKYTNKGVVLTHPNSLKQHLFKGQNFMKRLRANRNLIKYMENTQAMSTIDGEYDGIRPVLIDENFVMTSPFNWNELFSFSGATKYDPSAMMANPYIYGFSEKRATYYTHAHHMLLKGIYDWISRHASNLRRAAGTKAGDTQIFNIPIVYSATNLTAWSFLVLAAMADIEKARAVSMREVIFFEQSHGELFTDLVSLGDYPTTTALGFAFTDIDTPIKLGKLPEQSYYSWVIPELFWAVDEVGGNKHTTVVPWYFNEEQFSNDGLTSVYLDFYKHKMSYPLVRSGITHEALDRIVSDRERDVRLMIDRMVYPMVKTVAYSKFSVYKYDLAGDGIPAIELDLETLTLGNYLKTPRELGLGMVAPAGYVVPNRSGDLLDSEDTWNLSMSYRAKVYVGDLSAATTPNSNLANPYDSTSVNIDRASLYNQGFFYSFAEVGQEDDLDAGFSLSIREMFTVASGAANSTFVTGKSVFNPFVSFGTGANQVWRNDASYSVITLQKAMWLRMQLLPFLINPWDAVPYTPHLGEDGQKFDIFDYAYMLGLAGFAASDFEEDHYNRMDRHIQQGYQFLTDLYLEETPLLK